MATINTNAGAMVALQNLNQTNRDLEQVQSRINTGLAISSAKDNGGIYAIAQKMRSDVAGYGAVRNSLDLAQSTTDVALAAGEAISDLLVEMKEKALAASDTSLDNLNASLAKLGTASKSLEVHKTFTSKLSDSLEKGIGNLVDADLAKESARLQSLQVKQQLGVQALSIANQAPQTILSFFG